jgi:HK97 family phage major capsid protein
MTRQFTMAGRVWHILRCERGEIAVDLLTAGMVGPRITLLKQAHVETAQQMAAIRTLVQAESRAMSDDERTKFKGLEAKLGAIEDELAIERRAQERERAMRPVPDANQETVRRAESAVQIGRDLSVDDPMKGFKSHQDFLAAVMAAARGQRQDARLAPLKQVATAGSDEAGEYSNPYGGYLVPTAFSPTLLQLQPENDPMSSAVRRIPMSSPVVTFPARVDKNHSTSVTGGLTVTRRPETVAGSSSRTEFELVTLRAAGLFGLSFASEEIMNDSPISFVAMLTGGFRAEFTSHAINERLNGTGVGEFEGVLNSPALVSVAKEVGQAADTINYENIKNMRSRVWGYGQAIWLANHDTMPELMSLVQVVGTGGAPVYMPSAREDAPDLLFGRPIIYTEYCEALGDKGDIVCGNWREYLEGTLQPIQSAESMHVRFVEHERAFKFYLRNDGKCWWRSPLTPKKSAKTMSPFVTLDART